MHYLLVRVIGVAMALGGMIVIARSNKLGEESISDENLTPQPKESKTIDEDAKSIPPLIVETPETDLTGPPEQPGANEQ